MPSRALLFSLSLIIALPALTGCSDVFWPDNAAATTGEEPDEDWDFEEEPDEEPEPPTPEELIARVVELTNEARGQEQDCGTYGVFGPVAPLRTHPLLHRAAQAHADDMARNDFVSHEGTDGSRVFDRIPGAGYPRNPIGENIATGYRTAEEVVAGLLDSDDHCLVMMNDMSGHMGVGLAYADTAHGIYWVQVFAE